MKTFGPFECCVVVTQHSLGVLLQIDESRIIESFTSELNDERQPTNQPTQYILGLPVRPDISCGAI